MSLIKNGKKGKSTVNEKTLKEPRRGRVAILGTRGIPAKYGGFETFAERLSIGLIEEGFEVAVFCEEGTGQLEDVRGVNLVYCKAPKMGPLTTIVYDLRSLWAARRGFDVVYMLGYGASLFCFLPRLWGNRVWINMDGLEWKRSKWGFVARNYFKVAEAISLLTANRVIADARAIANYLTSKYGKWFAWSFIPYGCDIVTGRSPVKLRQWDLDPEQYCLVVCRLEPENHVREIIEAYVQSSLSKPLIIVGDNSSSNSYVRRICAIKDPRIRFIGAVFDKESLQSLRVHSFAYLHGHSVGGTNPSLLEAMGCGNLVLAHDNPFNRETLEDAALFFRNAEDLTAILNNLEIRDDQRTTMREKARKRAADQYAWSSIVAQYSGLLRTEGVGAALKHDSRWLKS